MVPKRPFNPEFAQRGEIFWLIPTTHSIKLKNAVHSTEGDRSIRNAVTNQLVSDDAGGHPVIVLEKLDDGYVEFIQLSSRDGLTLKERLPNKASLWAMLVPTGLGYKHPLVDKDARYQSLLLPDGSPFGSLGYASVEYVYSRHWTNLAAYHPQHVPYPPMPIRLSAECMDDLESLCWQFAGWRSGGNGGVSGEEGAQTEGQGVLGKLEDDSEEEEEGRTRVKRKRKRRQR